MDRCLSGKYRRLFAWANQLPQFSRRARDCDGRKPIELSEFGRLFIRRLIQTRMQSTHAKT